MINIAELRIGSVVRFKGRVVMLDASDFAELVYHDKYLNPVKGVPVDLDVFAKLGFTKANDAIDPTQWRHEEMEATAFEWHKDGKIVGYGIEIKGRDYLQTHVKYVHEIQNAIMFILRKEIKVNAVLPHEHIYNPQKATRDDFGYHLDCQICGQTRFFDVPSREALYEMFYEED